MMNSKPDVPSDGADVGFFIENLCRVTKGEASGTTIRLRPWQTELLHDLFVLRPDGRRRFRQGLIGMPRKNGKSALGAGFALFGLVADGEQGAEVYSCAGDREQARIVFGTAKRMVELDPALSEVVKTYRDALEVPSTGSVYRCLSAEAYTKEGLNPSLVIFDEVHVQPNRELWDVMTLGSGTRSEPLVLGITTAGVMTDSSGQDSLCYQMYQYGKRVEAGDVEDPSFFFRWWEPARRDCDHRSPEVWAEANPAYGDFLDPEDFEASVRRTPENEYRTKRLNQWVAASETWLPYGAWSGCTNDRRVLAEGERVVLFFDGSFSGDSTGLVACSLDDYHLEVVGHWEQPLGDDDWRVDIFEAEQQIEQACRFFDVVEVACDPFRWQRSMQALMEKGVPIVEYPTSAPSRMVPACAKFYDAVIDGKLSHAGDDHLARHVDNCVVKTDRLGPRIVKEHKMSKRRIDLAVCAVGAFDRATAYQEVEPGIRFI